MKQRTDSSVWASKGRQSAGRSLLAVFQAETHLEADLEVCHPAILDLPADLARTEPDPEIQSLISASAGLNIALDYLPGSATFDPLVFVPDVQLASAIVWFDAFVCNVDRTVRNVNMLMPAPYKEGHDAYLERHLQTGERRIIGIGRVVVGLRKSGETLPMELQVSEFALAGNRFFTGFVRDLTEQQAAKRRIQDLQAELSHTSRLSVMGQMASTMALELNQPLSAVMNYLEAARHLLASGSQSAERIDG